MNHLNKTIGRLTEASRDGSLSQSILLTGRRGVGKFSVAMKTATALLCENDRSGCGECRSCKDIGKLIHPDFLLLFPFPNIRPESKKVIVFPFSDPVSSAARFSEDTRDEVERFREVKTEDPYTIVEFGKKENIPAETVRDLRRALSKKPLKGGRRVVVILDIDKMAFGAADLFLKTVEEPPENTHLILTTSRPDLLLPTLLSRTHIVKIPPASTDELKPYLVDRLEINDKEASFLAGISGGSPGEAVYLYYSDIVERRERIVEFFSVLCEGKEINRLIDNVNRVYSIKRPSYEEIRLDFEIMESLIHDLYMIGQNGLDKYLLNVDIKGELTKMGRPEPEALDLWKECCAETKKACLINNVAVGTAMPFFYISCAKAMVNPAGQNFTLP
ncbi:MAG: hypothetical protein V3W18_08770 [candidate division Zixibacteria bacterium]